MSLGSRLLRALHITRIPKRTFQFEGRLVQMIEQLAAREQRPENEVAAEMLTFALARRKAAEANLRCWQGLSPREKQVIALVCLNFYNREIAERLVISPETVKTHVRNVLYKFNLRTKSELRLALADWDFSAWQEHTP